MKLTKHLSENMRVRCIVENTSGSTLTHTVWSHDSAPKLYVMSSELSKEDPFPFPQVKMFYDLNYPAPSINYASKRILQGYIVTGRDIQHLSHVSAYLRGRIGPFLGDPGRGVGPDGYAWVLTLNPDDDIAEFSMSQIKEFIGDPSAPSKLFSQSSSAPLAPLDDDTICNCPIC
jgi:hypothetical protein